MVKMGLLADFAEGFVIMTLVFWIYLIIDFIVMGQIGLALLLIIGLIPPLSMIASEYFKTRRKERP